MSDQVSPFRHLFSWLRNKFLAGLAIVIPMLVTMWILKVIHDFLHDLSAPLLLPIVHLIDPTIKADDPAFQEFTSFVGFLLPIVVLVALGVLATNVIGARMVVAIDQLMVRIPMISFIYKSLKQMMEAFRNFGGSRNFKRVVYVPYPASGLKLIGFVTGQFIDPRTSLNMSCVFMPGALSVMTGLVFVTETSQLEDAPLTVEEAMKMILSGGLIGPGADKKDKSSRSKAVVTLPPAVSVDFAHLPKADDHVENVAAVGVAVPRG